MQGRLIIAPVTTWTTCNLPPESGKNYNNNKNLQILILIFVWPYLLVVIVYFTISYTKRTTKNHQTLQRGNLWRTSKKKSRQKYLQTDLEGLYLSVNAMCKLSWSKQIKKVYFINHKIKKGKFIILKFYFIIQVSGFHLSIFQT